MPTEGIMDKFAELESLVDGWDGYGASPINAEAISAAKDFLQATAVVPTVNGGIALEWHFLEGDLGIGFKPDGFVESVYVNHNGWEIDTDELPKPFGGA